MSIIKITPHTAMRETLVHGRNGYLVRFQPPKWELQIVYQQKISRRRTNRAEPHKIRIPPFSIDTQKGEEYKNKKKQFDCNKVLKIDEGKNGIHTAPQLLLLCDFQPQLF